MSPFKCRLHWPSIRLNGRIHRDLIRKVFSNGSSARQYSKAVSKVYQSETPMLDWDLNLVSFWTRQSETINIYFKDTVRIKKESGIWMTINVLQKLAALMLKVFAQILELIHGTLETFFNKKDSLKILYETICRSCNKIEFQSR